MIKKILNDLDIDAYMDDVVIWFYSSFDEYIIIVGKVLECSAQDGIECNPFKCK